MTRPTKRNESSFLLYRKRVPNDVLGKARGHAVSISFPSALGHDAFTVRVRINETVKFSLRTREPALAKARTGLAEDQLQRTWDALRSGPKPPFGEWYRVAVRASKRPPWRQHWAVLYSHAGA